MKGILIDCYDESEMEVELDYEIRKEDSGVQGFYLLNGVTGYESFYIKDNVIKRMCKSGWCACAGTKPIGSAAGWDKLTISAEEMKKIFIKEDIL